MDTILSIRVVGVLLCCFARTQHLTTALCFFGTPAKEEKGGMSFPEQNEGQNNFIIKSCNFKMNLRTTIFKP
jgi:hypothetical protein